MEKRGGETNIYQKRGKMGASKRGGGVTMELWLLHLPYAENNKVNMNILIL